MKPKFGQVWRHISGATYRILNTGPDGRLAVVNLDTGCREWVDAAEFQFQHRPVRPLLVEAE